MADQHNYAALDWVVGEIEETLKQARQALEAHVENPKDTTQLRFCITHIHQVRGSLQIIEFSGASQLASEMEVLAQAMMSGDVTNINDAREVLMRSLLQLPIYLDHVKVYRDDSVVSILPLLNDICSVTRQAYYSEGEVFQPNLESLDLALGQRHPVLKNREKLIQVTSKLREMYQFAAASVLRNIKVEENLEYVEKVFSRLISLSSGTACAPLWISAAALVEGITSDRIELSVGVQGLFRRLAKELRVLSEGAPVSFDAKPPEGLIKNILYYIASSDANGPLAKKVTETFSLLGALPGSEEGEPGYSINSLDPEAVRSVVVALREELKGIKSNLDEVLNAQIPLADLAQAIPVVKRVADTLSVLGIQDLREKMLKQAEMLQQISGMDSLDASALLESAEDIIEVDSKLEAIDKAVDMQRDLRNINERTVEIDDAKRTVIRECQVGIEKAKEAIIEYISSQWDRSQLENIDVLLRDIRGGLEIVSLSRAGKVIGSCSQFIVDKLMMGSGQAPSWDKLELLADAMAGVEYFLERLSKDMNEEVHSLLDIAEQSVLELGYPSSLADAETAESQAFEPVELNTTPEAQVASEQGVAGEQQGQPDTFINESEPESDIDEEIVAVFIEEAGEVFDTLGDYLPRWLEDNDDEALVFVRRSYHTLKGSGRMVEAHDIGELSWSIENMLNRVLDKTVQLGPEYGQLVYAVTGMLPAMVEAFKMRQPNPLLEQTELASKWAFLLADGEIPQDFNVELLAPEALPAETGLPLQEDAAFEEEDYTLLEIFSSEVDTHLDTIRAFVQSMDDVAPLYTCPTDELQRALHTLKGSAKMAQVTHIAQMYERLEGFAKEMVTFQVVISPDVLQLIRDAVTYTESAQKQIAVREPVAIEKLEQFLARAAELREMTVGHLVRMKELEKDGDKPVDPRLLSIFMAEEMNLLLDADDILKHWCQDPYQEPRIPNLMHELVELANGAELAKLPEMARLSLNLSKLCGLLWGDLELVDESAEPVLLRSHEALLDMVDAVAAGQNVLPPPEQTVQELELYIQELEQGVNTSPAEQADTDSYQPVLESDNSESLPSYSVDEYTETDVEEPDTEALGVAEPPEFEEAIPPELPENDEMIASEADVPELETSYQEEQAGTDNTSSIEEVSEQNTYLDNQTFPNIPGDLLDSLEVDSEDFDADILEVFLEEASELSEELDDLLSNWEEDSDISSLEEMKRALHTMKGGARLSSMVNLGDLVHNYETFLERLAPESANADTFAQAHTYQDRIVKGIAAVKAELDGLGAGAAVGEPVQSADTFEAEEQRDAGAAPDVQPEQQYESSNIVPFVGVGPTEDTSLQEQGEGVASDITPFQQKKTGPQEVVRVNSDLLEELVNLAGETSISRARLEEQVNEFRGSLGEVDATISRLQEQLRRLDIETEAQVLFRREQMAHEESFDPLEMDRYSNLQQLSRSLIESASDLQDLRSDLAEKVKDAETILLQQSRINTTLQEGLMRSRMVPFSRMVPRLRRIVRQVASELGKKVSFELDNVEGELDRSVLERMVPPFEHMLRNAVDHGIESPEERVSLGKPETGRIVLSLRREGSNVVMRLADDGRGIDLDRVRQKAIERGLMDPNADLNDHDVMQFILHAGFSTAENVTQISGRGVGMDVVHAEIKQLGGDVSINSSEGQGTEFLIRLPFTLSVNRALMVRIGQEHYAIPLNTIEGIVRISPFELEHYYSHPDAEFEYADDKFKVRYLGSLLYPGDKPKIEGQSLPMPIILVRTAEHAMALQVDALMGSREVVVKSLGVQFSAVPGLNGATIMGDGKVVVILDPHALVRQELASAERLEQLTEQARQMIEQRDEHVEEERVKTVMVVDDSVTVRRVTTRFLEREGYNTITAKDGVEALQILQDQIPDIMLLDIEMPRMDGFEVAKNIRSSQRWKELPIIMITSRTGDKHREHAESLGVNRYLGKPYQEEILLETIHGLIGEEVEA